MPMTLFEASRQDTPLATSVTSTGKPRLQGISIAGVRRRALISFGDGAPVWLAAGETNGAFTLTQIGASKVRLATPDGVAELELFPGSKRP